MSNEQQARKMLTSSTKTTGGFEYAGEYYTACCAFLSGTDPSMPSKALIHPNEQTVDRLLKVTGGNSKLHTGEGLITKAKRDRAELQTAFAYQRGCSLVSKHRFWEDMGTNSRRFSPAVVAGAL